jgi:hypothetical protein
MGPQGGQSVSEVVRRDKGAGGVNVGEKRNGRSNAVRVRPRGNPSAQCETGSSTVVAGSGLAAASVGAVPTITTSA